MSWADDIRCLYCDGRLPLYRKITNGQFCSSAHRKAYWQEQERLAVERLHQTHDSLRAYRPAGVSVEAILGQPETPQETERPRWLTLANTGQVPIIGFYPDPTPLHPRWLPEHLAGSEALPFDGTQALRRPILLYGGESIDFAFAGLVRIPFSERDSKIAGFTIEPALLRTSLVYNVALNLEIDGDAVGELVELVKEEIPEMAGLLVLLRPSPRNYAIVMLGVDVAPLAILLRSRLPLDSSATVSGKAAPISAGSVPLQRFEVVKSAASEVDVPRALDLRRESAAPELALSTPPLRPRLRLATGRRYAVRFHEQISKTVPPSALSSAPGAVTLPERRVKVAPVRNAKQIEAPAPMQEPNAAGMVKLPCTAKAKATGATRIAPSSTSLPQPAHTDPMRPTLKLDPIGEIAGPSAIPDFAVSQPPYAAIEAALEQPRAHVWTHAADFWNRAPRDLKLLAFAIPVLLGLALHPGLPKVRFSSPANTTGMQHSFEQAMNTQWSSVKQSLVDRAAVALDEDFRAGLDDWASRWSTRGDGNAEWSFDATGFVKPGPLALYKPSVGLTDYQMQFLGMIDKKALSWVVRAADFDNFYVVKLEVLKPGPLPTIGITRYAVVNGKADSRVDTVVPMDARSDTLYRVLMDVHGDDFSLTVQGQMVDAWTEPRLKHGGIGFFSARGEDSRVRWVQVTHQYDMLGRLCAYLAPYNIPSSSGSLQP